MPLFIMCNTLDINECEDNNPCDPRTEECTNSIGNYTCSCLLGYSRNEQGTCQGNKKWLDYDITIN